MEIRFSRGVVISRILERARASTRERNVPARALTRARAGRDL